MANHSILTDKEVIVFLHCRLTALERYIAAIHPHFYVVMADWSNCELDNDPELSSEQRTKIEGLAAEIKDSYNQDKR